MLTCPACGATAEPGWRHCGSCGAELADAPPAAPETPPRGAWPALVDHPRTPRLVAAAVAVLLFAALPLAIAERRADNLERDLRETRVALRDTRAILAATKAELAARVGELGTARGDLERTSSSLAEARRSVESQSAQLKTIRECFDAIGDMSDAYERGDGPAAQAAAQRVDKECSEAEAFF